MLKRKATIIRFTNSECKSGFIKTKPNFEIDSQFWIFQVRVVWIIKIICSYLLLLLERFSKLNDFPSAENFQSFFMKGINPGPRNFE